MTECFQLDERDNVAVLLRDAAASEELLIGGAATTVKLRALEAIRTGHKIAVRAIADGERVMKFGYPIGEATHAIQAGEWVHLHNCRSLYDPASSALDVHSGARTGTAYA